MPSRQKSYSREMRKSACVHCVRVFRLKAKTMNVVELAWGCEFGEYDPVQGCGKGKCNYYEKAKP